MDIEIPHIQKANVWGTQDARFGCTISAMPGVRGLYVVPLALAALLTSTAGLSQDQSPRLSIVVDKACMIQPESDFSVVGDHSDAFRDDSMCHLESVLSSQHVEVKITDGERSRVLVRIAEQEYVVQNPTDKPAVFVVRHDVPENWQVDSDPHPLRMEGSTAVFEVLVEPRQRVRLHVGMRSSNRMDSK